MEVNKAYQKICLSVYHTSFFLVITGLFFSRVLISLGFLLFFINWFIEGDYKNKWILFKQNYQASIISLVFIIHLLGLINTSDLSYGLSELKVKLPLLLSLFLISSPKVIYLFKTERYLLLFVLCAITASIYSLIRFEIDTSNNSIEDLYKISLTGQNIQVSLFAIFATSIIYYLLFYSKNKFVAYQKVFLIISMLWLVVYVYLLNSLTGYIVMTVILVFSIFYSLWNKSRFAASAFAIAIVIIILFVSVYLIQHYEKFNQAESVNFSLLEKNTENGNLYLHDTISKRNENGHYIDIYICRDEMEKSWKSLSKMPFKGKDNKGQEISETISRYLTSRGLKKDSAGMAQLSASDITAIENGCANYLYTNKYSIESRAYNIYWQIKTYNETGNSTAQSVSQRIEFLKAAKILIRENLWFGVGPGDVMDSFRKTLDKMNTKLAPAYYNRVHNQYIVELVALGIFGFFAFLFILFYPVFRFKIWNNYLFSSFYIIVLISFFTDNPLETQLGVSFFSAIYCILIVNYLQIKEMADMNGK